jgi:glyoxylase-like metal-dependent hydrolase (beta-lactamase superfamily II)
MDMIIKRIPVGPLMANCYIVGDALTKEVIIIDPGDEAEKIFSVVEEDGYKVVSIALNHAHFDHVGALDAAKDRFGVPVINKEGIYHVGRHEVKALKTPGHSDDGLSFLCGNCVFTGDVLFRMSVGRTDLGGDFNTLRRSIHELYKLPEDTVVYPGHGLTTTIGKEKKYNPFVRAAYE